MKRTVLILLLLTTAACAASGQRRLRVQDHETIRRTIDFSTGAGRMLLEVDNVQGSIRLTGYDGRSVEMVANKTIRAVSQDKLQQAQQEVKLDIRDQADTINIYVDQPGHERSSLFGSHSHWTNPGYEVSFDFELRVPRQASVRLWTVNGGEIRVEDIAGDFEVNNVNGNIDLRQLSGSGEVRTVNGAVKVAFAANPKNDSSFASLNGAVEVTFQRNLSADIRYKTFNGGVYTDFPVTARPAPVSVPERRNGGFIYKSDFSGARIGNGGPELTFDGFNGDIRILQAK